MDAINNLWFRGAVWRPRFVRRYDRVSLPVVHESTMLSDFNLIVLVACALVLFLFGIDSFSREVQVAAGARFRLFLTKATRLPVVGLLLGAVVTGVVQSSAATMVITIGLVNNGVISFANSLGIVLGANIGTTVTAQLVAFRLTDFAPFFLLAGFILGFTKSRYAFLGKPVFYFGLVFFSLNMLSQTLAPLQTDAETLAFLAHIDSLQLAVLYGVLFTVAVQSSSVTTGLVLVLLQNGLLGAEPALGLILGSNIGSTVTALLASIPLDAAARRTAVANLLFNVIGVSLALLVLLLTGTAWLLPENISPAIWLANVHLVFNLLLAFSMLLVLQPFSRLVKFLIKSDYEDTLPLLESIREDDDSEDVGRIFHNNIRTILGTIPHTYNVATIALETRDEVTLRTARKSVDFLEFSKEEINRQLIVYSRTPRLQGQAVIRHMACLDYIFQIHDSLADICLLAKQVTERRHSLSIEFIESIRDIASKQTALMREYPALYARSTQQVADAPEKEEAAETADAPDDFNKRLAKLNTVLDEQYRKLLTLMDGAAAADAAHMTRFVSLNIRLRDKLLLLKSSFQGLMPLPPEPKPDPDTQAGTNRSQA